MTDEMSDVLSGLTPTVIPVDGADPELVEIGERYWAFAGFHPELDTPVWCEKTADIDTLGWGGPLYVLAAAGVRAVVDRTCPQCQEQLSLTSRTALAELLKGGAPVCAACTESLVTAVQALNDPKRKAKREAARTRAAEQKALDTALAAWNLAQLELMQEHYQLRFSESVPTTPVRDMVAALAVLRYAPSTTPISQIGSWPDPLHPERSKTAQLLGSLVRSGLLRIHPTTPVKAMEWQPASFQDALAAAGGDLDAVDTDPQLTSQFYPLDSCFYAPFATSPGAGAQHLDTVLSARLAPESLTAGQHDDLLSLAQALIAEEALRYFRSRLVDLNLPEVTDNHIERLREAAYKLARHRPLAEIYNLVWRSTRAAAESAQKNPRAPRINMSTHAVNQFETHAQRAVTEAAWLIKPFGEVAGCGPSAMIRTLFYTVLDLHPLETSVPDIEQKLPEPAPEPPMPDRAPQQLQANQEDEYEEVPLVLNWLHSHPDRWSPQSVGAALETLAQTAGGMEYEVEQRVFRRGIGHLQRMQKHLSSVLDERQTALAVLAATDLLHHPVTSRDMTTNQPVGSVIFEQLYEALFPSPDDL